MRPALGGGAQEESYSYREEESPPFSLVGLGLGGKEQREERKGGAPPPLLVQFGLGGEGRATAPRPPLLFLH